LNKLKKVLKTVLNNQPFKIIARGPFAGLIALKLNLENCLVHVSGRYRIEMCSDDYLEPTCIEKAVKTFIKYPNSI
jgi:hypothetical protein